MNSFAQLAPHDIAEAMGVSVDILWRWARNPQALFKPARQEIVKEKERTIEPPHFWAKQRLRRLHRLLQKDYSGHRNAHGGVKGRSCFTGAKKHLGRGYVVIRDISQCYPSVTTDAVRDRLLAIGFRYETALVLAKISTVGNHLPQGSPISSDILNLFLYDADEGLARVLEKQGVRLHRCYDDVVGSTNSRKVAVTVGESIEAAIAGHGLQVNERKRAKNGLTNRNRRQTVHNLDVSNPAGVAIRREDMQKATAIAEAYVRGARSVGPDTLEIIAQKRQQVAGYICHFDQAKFSNAGHLRMLLKHGDSHVIRKLFGVGLDARKWYVRQRRINRPRRLAEAWRGKQQSKAA